MSYGRVQHVAAGSIIDKTVGQPSGQNIRKPELIPCQRKQNRNPKRTIPVLGKDFTALLNETSKNNSSAKLQKTCLVNHNKSHQSRLRKIKNSQPDIRPKTTIPRRMTTRCNPQIPILPTSFCQFSKSSPSLARVYPIKFRVITDNEECQPLGN